MDLHQIEQFIRQKKNLELMQEEVYMHSAL